MIRRGPGLLVAAALALAACGNAPELRTPFLVAIEDARATLSQRDTTPPLRPTAGFPGLDPAVIAGRTEPTMGAWLPLREAVAGLGLVAAQGGHAIWQTADNSQITLAGGGVLVSTRGLGADLHASDAAQTVALITAGRAGTATRRHVWVDPLYRQIDLTLSCTITPAGRETLRLNGRAHPVLRLDEACTGSLPTGPVAIANTYWRDVRGPTLRQSIQWIGPDLGQIYLQRLVD
jgi:hypothetical protein